MITQGKRIKLFRENAKIKQDEVARILAMSQSNYSRIENDEINPSQTVIEKLAQLFQIEKEQLLSTDLAVNFNNCNQAFYKYNTINYSITEELKNLYEDKIKLLEEKILFLENRTGV